MTQQNFTVDNGLTVAGSGGNITGANTVYANTVNTITLYATAIYSGGQLVNPGGSSGEPIANIVAAGLVATNTNTAIEIGRAHV